MRLDLTMQRMAIHSRLEAQQLGDEKAIHLELICALKCSIMEHKPRELKLHVKEIVPANQKRQAGTGFQEPSAAPLLWLFSC